MTPTRGLGSQGIRFPGVNGRQAPESSAMPIRVGDRGRVQEVGPGSADGERQPVRRYR